MNFIIIFIYIPLVHSASHTFMTTYTGINGQRVAGTPEFLAVTTLDGEQIDYYDSEIKKLIPRQDWMKEFTSKELWKEDTETRKNVQQIYKNNIAVLMQRFNQTSGVHTYQRMYGCVYDNDTGDTHGFDEYGYDGEDFITLDLKELRYVAYVSQAEPTVQKWNNGREQLDYLKQYYKYECVYWLKKFSHFSKATFNKTGIVLELPGQSLTEAIQKIQTEPASDASFNSHPDFIILAIIPIILIPIALYNYWKKSKYRKITVEFQIY